MIDHHARAERLRAFMGELSHVRDLEHEDVDLDGEIPRVSCRFAASEFDGNESVVNFFDSVEDANASAGDLGGEYPWAPGLAIDLDTGVTYEPIVTVRFKPLRWVVKVSFSWSDRVHEMRFPTKAGARAYLRQLRANDNDVTVLEGPVDTLKEAVDG